MLKAVIFDLDGVIADSHPLHEEAWTALLVEQGLDQAAINLDFLYAGHPRREILWHYLGALNTVEMEELGRRKDELYRLVAHKLRPKTGIPELLSELGRERILCGLATSAARERTFETLEKFSIREKFAAIVTGNETPAAKPAPDIFLLAAQRLGVEAKSCLVVEDSGAGVAAARAAGMKCVGFAPPKFFASLAAAGADDLVNELPPDGPAYFRRLHAANPTQGLGACG